jgi:hypothetical protein
MSLRTAGLRVHVRFTAKATELLRRREPLGDHSILIPVQFCRLNSDNYAHAKTN